MVTSVYEAVFEITMDYLDLSNLELLMVNDNAQSDIFTLHHPMVPQARNGSPVFSESDEIVLDVSSVDELLESFMVKVVDENHMPVWQCNECGKMSKYITNMKGHIEANHVQGLKFNCSYCEKIFKSRASLRNHVSNFHKNRDFSI